MSIVFPTPEEARVEFHQLLVRQQEIISGAKSARDAFEAKRNELAELERTELAPLIADMQTAETGLFEINQQMGRIVRYLNGDTALPEHKV